MYKKGIKIFGIIITIFAISLPSFFLEIKEDNLKDIINQFIGVIGGIVGITFSFYIVYIQKLSDNFSGAMYNIVIKRIEPFLSFILFISLILVLIYLNINVYNINGIFLGLTLYYSIISLFLAFYFLWDLFKWSIDNMQPLKIIEYFSEKSKEILAGLNKDIKKGISQKNKDIIYLYFESNREKSIYHLYNSFLQLYTNNNGLSDSKKQIIEIFFNLLREFLIIFKNNFYIHPDLYVILASNSTFTNFFAKLLIQVNRNCDKSIFISGEYETLNSILYGYRDLIVESLKIKYNGNNTLNDENPILSIILGQFNDLGAKIIEHKEYEGAFTWLRISQELGPNLINSNYYINIVNFLEGLEKFLISINVKYDNVLLQEHIKSYILILNQISLKGDSLNYLYNYFGQILNGIKHLLIHKAIKLKDGIDLQSDLTYQNIFTGIRNLNILYINGKLDKSNIFFNNDIRKFLEDFVNGLFYKQNEIKDYIHIKWFCELLLNMLEDELEKGGKNNFYLYYETIEKLSKLVINVEKGDEFNTVFDYQIKIFSLIIKYDLDDYKLYYKDFEELINLYKNLNDKRYNFMEKIYKELSLILVLLKKEGKEFFGLDELIKNYEKSENEKMKEGYNGDLNDIKHYLNPITRYLLDELNYFDKNERNDMFYSSFNSFFDEWFIRKFNITKEDFKNYLGIKD